jgi:hypothetical protein
MVIDHAFPGITSSPNTELLVAALCKAQAEYPAIEKGGNNTFGKYKYMRYSDICEALREPLLKHGLPLPQIKLAFFAGQWVVVGTLSHISGQFVTSLCPLYLGFDKEGAPRQDMQSLGSAVTYAKKYLLLGLVGGWAEDDDDAQKTKAAPARSSAPRAVKTMEIEAKARKAIDAAKDTKAIESVLNLVKLRISERVAEPSLLTRMQEYAAGKKEKEVASV